MTATFHIIAVLATAWVTPGTHGTDRVSIREIVPLNPDKIYTSVAACRSDMQNDPGVHSAIDKTAHLIVDFIQTSVQPGKQLANIRDVVLCAPTRFTLNDAAGLE